MKYIITTLFVLLLGTVAWAQVPYYPMTSIAEVFTASWCTNCPNAYAGLDVVESQRTPGDFFSVRYYTQSGPDWEFAGINDRISYYNILGVPSVVFNGKKRVDGGIGMEDGSIYADSLASYRFASSPVKMEILDFNPQTLVFQLKVTMYDSLYAMTDAPLYMLLLQDSVGDTHKNVTRDMKVDAVNLAGAGSSITFQRTFTPSVTVNPDSIWAAAFIQTGDHTVLQSVCSKPMPDYYSRIVLPFKQNLTGDLDAPYQSIPFPVWNLGEYDNFTIKLVMDDAPGYWDLGFCNTSGSCFPQNMAIPFSLSSGEYTRFYLDVNPHVSGVAHFHFEINQEHGTNNPIIIPFTYSTSDVPNDDHSVPAIQGSSIANYPNPFNSETRIEYRFQAKNTDMPALEIYNLKGQKVRQFTSLPLDNSFGSLSWNGTDDSGNILPSGIYFSRIRGIGDSKAHKMILIR